MAKRRPQKLIEELLDDCASANECTGMYQKVSLDTDEIAKFHKQYTEDEEGE